MVSRAAFAYYLWGQIISSSMTSITGRMCIFSVGPNNFILDVLYKYLTHASSATIKERESYRSVS